MDWIKNIKHLFSGPDKWVLILIGCVWAQPLMVLLIAISLRLPIPKEMASVMDKIIPCIFAILALRRIVYRIKKNDILLYIFCVAVYLLQFIFHPENEESLSEYVWEVLLFTIPAFFTGIVIDIQKTYKYLFVLSILSITFYGFHDLIFVQSNTHAALVESDHNMTTAYSLLPHILFVLYYTIKNINIIGIMYSILGVFLLLSYGTRGPVACYMIFVILILLFTTEFKRKYLAIFFITILFSIIYIFIEPILLFIGYYIDSFGLSTRIIERVITGGIENDEGRLDIVTTLKTQLEHGPSTGFGLFGSWRFVDIYAHRIYWDFWFSFGYYMGTIFMAYFVYWYIQGARYCKDKKELGFYIILLCSGLISLMFSHFFLFKGIFWLFLGYCVGRKRQVHLE